jgi:hypothetical protein
VESETHFVVFLVSLEISAVLGRHARTDVDAGGWLWEITRGDQIANLLIESVPFSHNARETASHPVRRRAPSRRPSRNSTYRFSEHRRGPTSKHVEFEALPQP